MTIGTNLEGSSFYASAARRDLFAAAAWVDLAAVSPGPNTAQNGLVNPDDLPVPAPLPCGLPATLEPTQAFTYAAFAGRSVPAGAYRLVTSGKGQFYLHPFYSDGTSELLLIAPDGGQDRDRAVTFRAVVESLSVYLIATDPADPIARISLFSPDAPETPGDAWNPPWVARLAPFPVVRTMDRQAINRYTDTPTVPREWADRNAGLYTDAGDNGRGERLETLFELANVHGKDLWLCVPDRASDDYIRRSAALCRDGIRPGRRVYLELGNEMWNGSFQQAIDNYDAGEAAGIDKSVAGPVWYARRVKAVADLFAEAYGPDFAARVTVVLAGQFYNDYALGLMLDEWERLGGGPCVLAVAPYFAHTIAHGDPPDDAASVAGLTPDQLLNRIESAHLPACLAQMDAVRTVAAKHGVPVVAYECGQHLRAPDAPDADRLAALFEAACGHPRMEGIYAAFLAGLASRGATLAMNFSFVVRPSKDGQWGILGTAEDDPETSPRYRALERFAMAKTGTGTVEPTPVDKPAPDPKPVAELIDDVAAAAKRLAGRIEAGTDGFRKVVAGLEALVADLKRDAATPEDRARLAGLGQALDLIYADDPAPTPKGA